MYYTHDFIQQNISKNKNKHAKEKNKNKMCLKYKEVK